MTEVYNIEPEELDEIEYYEIITLDEIIKENPTFIAFSREEIFDELYNFFKNSNKASMLTDLFYKNNSTDIINYVFVANAEMKEVQDDIEEFIKDFKAMTRMRYKECQAEKNKYFFALTYDIQSQNIRLKPYAKTTIELQDTNKAMNFFYPVSAEDDTNIPILAAYYNAPTSTLNDYLSQKVISHTMKKDAFNYAESDAYSDINKLISVVKPKMQTIVDKMQIDDDDFDLDYNHLNNILNRFNTSLEDIHISDFEILKQHLQPILEIKPHTIKYKKFRIKENSVSNDKIDFYNMIQNITNLLSFPEKMKEDYALLIATLEDEKMNINAPSLLYNTINDIVAAVVNNDIQLEEIIQNLDANRKVLIIDHVIRTLKGINANDVENISRMLQDMTERFTALKGIMNDIFDFHFIDLYEDIKEIKEANDYTGYEGIPDIYKNDPNFEGMPLDDDEDLMDVDVGVNKITKMSLEKYWLSIDYKDALGFTEMLKIVLPIISNLQEVAVLQIDYDLLCRELYNRFAGIPTKFDMMRNIFAAADMKMSDDYIKDVVKITPGIALVQPISSVADDVSRLVQQCNREFIVFMYDMLYTAIAWWSLVIQEDILNATLIFDMNLCQASYIDKWSEDELPLKDSSKQDKGVLPYLAAILEDIMIENNDTGVPHAIIKNSMKVIEGTYAESIERLRNSAKNISKKKDKGAETYTNLLETIKERKKNRLLTDYIDALMYMPSYKYKKIHKFLLGCCLQKIGKEFTVDSDIDSNNRKGLIAAKKKYAANRETNKPRYVMYVPEVQSKAGPEPDARKKLHTDKKYDSDSDEDDIHKSSNDLILPVEPDIEDVATMQSWYESMYDKSSLFPNKILDIIIAEKSTKTTKEHADNFVECLCKTAGNRTQEFAGLFFNEKNVNYKNVLNMLCQIFNTFPTSLDDEKMLLQSAITSIQDIMKELDKLTECINEDNKADVFRIKKYIAARATCLPCSPDNAINNILYASINVSNGFVTQISKHVFTTLIKYLRMVDMPTMEDNIKFINTIREQNKVKILNNMNTKTVEERDLMNSLKKIGLKYDENDDDAPNLNPDARGKKDNDNADGDTDNDVDDDFFEEEEAEYALGPEDEYNDDDLDRAEYGFIYS
jgi:hypothetical protein